MLSVRATATRDASGGCRREARVRGAGGRGAVEQSVHGRLRCPVAEQVVRAGLAGNGSRGRSAGEE
jgi:hypothetical protein